MLRRVVRALRVGMLGLGVILFACVPSSYFVGAWYVTSLTDNPALSLSAGSGLVMVYVRDRSSTLPYVASRGISWQDNAASDASISRAHPTWRTINDVMYVGTERGTRVTIPLWLLAAICLAWPVTSLLLARRRRKGRGFAVEAGGGGPAPGIDPPPRRPDNIPPP